ncbi:hypothetical protein [Pyrococcus kukulkanii]|uniref:Uncharacterized protein n=1 Tax=Pyrococcus kukulkanii TaxID=1609559 RepID=A0ABV4T623_9EURY
MKDDEIVVKEHESESESDPAYTNCVFKDALGNTIVACTYYTNTGYWGWIYYRRKQQTA